MEIVRQNPLTTHLYDLRETISDVKNTVVDYGRATRQFLYPHRHIIGATIMAGATVAISLITYYSELTLPPLSKLIADFVQTENGKVILNFGNYAGRRVGPFDDLLVKAGCYGLTGMVAVTDAEMFREVLKSRKSNPRQKE